MTICPRCSSEQTVKNGRIHNGKQNYRCRDCGRQFVLNRVKKVVSEETKERIDRLLLEKLPLAGIARVEGVSESWLQGYVNRKYQQVKRQVAIKEKKGR